MSLKNKLIKGSIWSIINHYSTAYINLGVLFVLAYMLGPEAFGILAMVAVITGFLGYFTEFGLIANLIQKKDIDQIDCDTVFWSSVAISIIIYAIVYAGAPLVSMFYGVEELTLITRVIFIDFLIKPFYFVPSAIETKNIKYNILAISNIIAVISSATIAIVLALYDYGVWALVVQRLCHTFLAVVLIITFTKYKPGLKFSFTRLKEMLPFGIQVMSNNLLKYFTENVDYLLVGRMLGEMTLGIYTFAFRLSRYPLEKVSTFFGKMLFPAFSTMQNQKERLQKNFIRISVAKTILLIPPLLVIFFAAEPIIKLLGDKWQATAANMAMIIRIFAGYLLFQASCYADEPMLIAMKKVNVLNITKTLTSVALPGIGYFAIKQFGIIGMSWTYMAVTLAMILVIKFYVIKTLEIKFGNYIRSFSFVSLYFLLNLILAIICMYYRFSFKNDFFYIAALTIGLCVASGIMLLFKKIVFFRKPFFDIDHVIKVK